MSLRIGCRADDDDKHTRDVWSMDLVKLAEVQAHPITVSSIAASDDTLFCCSNDGIIKSFDLETLKLKSNIIHEDNKQFWKLLHDGECLYAGDDEGTLKIWKHGQYFGSLLADDVKDTAFQSTGVSLMKKGEALQYGLKNSFMGRGPITLVGDLMFAYVARNGKDIVIHENKDSAHYREIANVQGAHELVINALSGTIWNNKPIMFSGGWDKQIKKWLIDEDIVKSVGSVDADMVVNSIVIGDKGEIYAGGVDGHIIRVEVE
ncbi:hypothetical protein NQ317_002012 [Molorchus minor]|uniref:Uncharacterized protein n=1 Tax=Molorchus minor TaxID=1323400 RepID=A0ABQ9IRH0_9CUCU|nr:hypothetical protein NQ317_002012 [Molorchus minor]